MKVLVVGGGGREHALCWKLNQSPEIKKLYAAPGNAGISGEAECLAISVEDIAGIVKAVGDLEIDLVVVGPEAPLVAGLKERLEKRGVFVFGPSGFAAQLEGSKVWSKNFMKKYQIPTADFEIFDDPEKAKSFIRKKDAPIVVKADGLAAGKGVVVCESSEAAQKAVENIMVQKEFGAAGARVVVEECLSGEEVSFIGISDGENFAAMDTSQDHKRVFDGDTGPNTGGMGAYSPAPVITGKNFKEITEKIMLKTIRAMKEEGREYRGALYAGLMMTRDGPKVLEYNCRFGDPETQPLLFRLRSDLLPFLVATAKGGLGNMKFEWQNEPSVCVVMSSKGYPAAYHKGVEITGIEEANRLDRCHVFHAGTKIENKKLVTAGGRVLGVTSRRQTITEAISAAYQAVSKIQFQGAHFRTDIGKKALSHLGSGSTR